MAAGLWKPSLLTQMPSCLFPIRAMYVDSAQLVVHSHQHITKFGPGPLGQPEQLSVASSAPTAYAGQDWRVFDLVREGECFSVGMD